MKILIFFFICILVSISSNSFRIQDLNEQVPIQFNIATLNYRNDDKQNIPGSNNQHMDDEGHDDVDGSQSHRKKKGKAEDSEDSNEKWRCSFRCGAPQKSLINKDDSSYQQKSNFYLSVSIKFNDSEDIGLNECTRYFEDIMGSHYQMADRLCKQNGCNQPISRELLLPDNWRTPKRIVVEQKTVQAFGEKVIVEDNEKLEEETLLSTFDIQVMKMKNDLCEENRNDRLKAEIQMERFNNAVTTLSQSSVPEVQLNSIRDAISILTSYKGSAVLPFVNSMDSQAQTEIIDLFKQISNFLKQVNSQCGDIGQSTRRL